MKQYYATGLVCVLAIIGVVFYTYFDTPAVQPAEGADATTTALVVSNRGPQVSDVTSRIVGMWQSIEDPRFVREFKADGSGTDSYDGVKDAAGTWMVYTSADAPPSVSFQVDPNAVYVEMTIGGTEPDVLDFRVNAISDTALELTYMARGNTLSFTRIQ